MEFTEVQELDYIVAQSMSKNLFGGANTSNNKQKSGRYDSSNNSSDDENGDGHTRMSNNIFS